MVNEGCACSTTPLRFLDYSQKAQLLDVQRPHGVGRAAFATNTTHFKINGYEHAALSPERLRRCASACLDAYPQPRYAKAAWTQYVPPCLSTPGRPTSPLPNRTSTDVALGVPFTFFPWKAMLPTTFHDPRFQTLLFGYL